MIRFMQIHCRIHISIHGANLCFRHQCEIGLHRSCVKLRMKVFGQLWWHFAEPCLASECRCWCVLKLELMASECMRWCEVKLELMV